MLRIAFILIVLFAIAMGFAWLADHPGTVEIRWDYIGSVVELPLLYLMIGIAALVALVMIIWWAISSILHSPQAFGRWRSGRRRDRGYAALSQGLIAAGAGNAPAARRLVRDSSKLLSNEPLVDLLDAQTALLEGRREDARTKFEQMLENDNTRLLGLRGLYLEAQKEKEGAAAYHFATLAHEAAPETPWASEGLLKAQAAHGDWQKALKTLETSRNSGLHEKAEYNRKRAVILTALAMDEETGDPDQARNHAAAAHKLAPDFAPAAIIAARLTSRFGDLKKAARILETCWKKEPHPDVADTYVHLRSGDSTHDRLKRAYSLAEKRSSHAEGQLAIASAAIDAQEWDEARRALESALRMNPTERTCLLMADLEEAEHGDRGRVREWLSRALLSPKDAAWTADGYVSETWAPISPVTGELDAFEWRVPLAEIGGPEVKVDYSRLEVADPVVPVPVKSVAKEEDEEATVIELAIAASAVSVAASNSARAAEKEDVLVPSHSIAGAEIISGDDGKDEIDDAVIVVDEPETPTASKVTNAAVKEPEVVNGTAATPAAPSQSNSPYKGRDLDKDGDGIIDHRPDDPGTSDEPKKKKNLFF